MFGSCRMTRRPFGAGRPAPVVKHQGFGTGPGTRLFPSRSCALIVTQYSVRGWKGVVCESVRTVSPAEYDRVSAMLGLMIGETDGRLIVSLNVTRIDLSRSTPVAPSAGLVSNIWGSRHRVLNVHGFGLEPGTEPSCSPLRSFPDTWIVWVLHSG